MAKKNQLNVSVGVNTKGYKGDWNEAVKITQTAGASIEKEAQKMADSVKKKIENMSIKAQARQLENLTAKMAEAGLSGTKAFTQTAQAAGKLKAQIDDAKGIVEAFRPDAPFKALSTTLGAATQGFAGVQGAMALFGAESEETQKVLLKVQAAMAFSEGFKVLDGLQDGFTQLNLVIKENPLIAGVTIFAAAAAGLYALSVAADDTSEATERLNAVQRKVFDSTIKEKTELTSLLKIYNSKNTTDAERLRIQRELVEKYPEYLGQISTEKVETDKVNTAVTKYVELMGVKAKAQAFQELYIEALKKEQAAVEDIGGTWDDFLQIIDPFKRVGEEGLTNMELAAAAAGQEAAKMLSTYEGLLKTVRELEAAQQTTFGGKPPTTPTNPNAGPLPRALGAGPSSSGPQTGLIGGEIEDIIALSDAKKEATKSTQLLANQTIAEADAFKSAIKAAEMHGKAIDQAAYKQLQLQAVSDATRQAITDVFSRMAESIGSGLDEASTGFDRFVVEMGRTVIKLMGMALSSSISNAIMGATQTGAATGPLAAFTTPAFISAAVGGVLGAFAAIPKGFTEGGLIPGNSFSGDRLLAPVNSGEVVLNTGQQNALLRIANGGGGGGMLQHRIEGRDLVIWLDRARKDYSRG